jgi:molybdenum cofactor cytidylyltransferase
VLDSRARLAQEKGEPRLSVELRERLEFSRAAEEHHRPGGGGSVVTVFKGSTSPEFPPPANWPPGRAECLRLLDGMRLPARVKRHCRAVARLSARICRALKRRGLELDPRLAEAGGLLHDLAKGNRGHAEAGYRLVVAAGYEAVAEIVRRHIDLNLTQPGRLTELEVVYLADKLLDGCRLVGLGARRRQALRRKGTSAKVRTNIERRFEDARRILASIEARLGRKLPRRWHG